MANIELEDLITGLTAETSPDGAADYLILYDASGTALKKILLQNLIAGRGMVATPASAGATGVAGEWSISVTHFYLCVASNTWLRSTFANMGLATW